MAEHLDFVTDEIIEAYVYGKVMRPTTDQHPLTDEVIHREFLPKCCYKEDDLRAVADWQLEQVVDWLRDRLHFRLYLEPAEPLNHKIDVDYVIEDLQEAMRPTITQEDN